MRPQTEKPADQVMRFFTPDLFVRFNSSDDATADQANDEWETAIRAYRTHIDGLREQMPSQVRRLASLCLHDAEILASEQAVEPVFPPGPLEPFPSWTGVSILSVRQDHEVTSLIYVLWDRVRSHQSPEGWPFSRSRTHWLYDEIDIVSNRPGMFLHRVLLSDGAILEIPFVSALIHSFSLSESHEPDAARQSA
ncbi:hypothetical protein [Aquisphaera insulae]|uniref:hypothetical protein n=1 Tax=Aquisphaera insulae TaxID=2712864 RepID=UPI0013EBAFA1|nr:hypothetical protein [Aquisphaera insulae]